MVAAEHDCEQALADYLLEAIKREAIPSLVELQQRFGRPAQPIPEQHLQQHRLRHYDELLASFHQDLQEVAHG